MASIYAQTEQIRRLAEEERKISVEVARLAEEVERIRRAMNYKISAREKIAQTLDRMRNSMLMEANVLHQYASALSEIAERYRATENGNLSGLHVEKSDIHGGGGGEPIIWQAHVPEWIWCMIPPSPRPAPFIPRPLPWPYPVTPTPSAPLKPSILDDIRDKFGPVVIDWERLRPIPPAPSPREQIINIIRNIDWNKVPPRTAPTLPKSYGVSSVIAALGASSS